MSEKIPKGWKWVKLGEVAKYHFSTNKEEKLNKLVLKNLAKLNFWRVKGMSEWKEVKLKTICSDISYGYTASASKEKVGPKFLRITDITSGKINWDTVPYCRISEKDYHKYKLSIGDIVIARTGTLGSSAIIKNDIDAVFASYLIRFRIDEKLADPFFISYVLQSQDFKEYVNAVNSGSVQPGTNARQLGDYELPLPPLPEQKAIAEVLSSIDDKIDLLHRQNKTLEEMAMTLFRQWFIEPTKDGLPEGWEEVSLGEFFPVITGKKDANFATDDGSYPFFTCSQKPLKAPSYSFDGNAILLAGNGDFNIKRYKGKFEAYQRTYVLIPYNSEYFNFLYLLMKFNLDEITGSFKGSVINYITKDMITNFKFSLPKDRPSIKDKLLYFDRIYDKVDANTSQIQTLDKLRDTLLPKLMSRELRVKV